MYNKNKLVNLTSFVNQRHVTIIDLDYRSIKINNWNKLNKKLIKINKFKLKYIKKSYSQFFKILLASISNWRSKINLWLY